MKIRLVIKNKYFKMLSILFLLSVYSYSEDRTGCVKGNCKNVGQIELDTNYKPEPASALTKCACGSKNVGGGGI